MFLLLLSCYKSLAGTRPISLDLFPQDFPGLLGVICWETRAELRLRESCRDIKLLLWKTQEGRSAKMITEGKEKGVIANLSTWCHGFFQDENQRPSIRILMPSSLQEESDASNNHKEHITQQHMGTVSKSTGADAVSIHFMKELDFSWKIHISGIPWVGISTLRKEDPLFVDTDK